MAARTSRMAEIERQFGAPIDQLLAESYDRHLSTRKVSRELGVARETVVSWLQILHVPHRLIAWSDEVAPQAGD